jgi:hypothetical protein
MKITGAGGDPRIVDDDGGLAGPPEGLEYAIVDGRMAFTAERAGSLS